MATTDKYNDNYKITIFINHLHNNFTHQLVTSLTTLPRVHSKTHYYRLSLELHKLLR